MKKITIFDTTLRDGQQCPGAGMSFEQNIKFAHMIAKAMKGNGVIEAGFPAASNTDFTIVSEISKQVGSSPDSCIIAGLSQCIRDQIDKTIKALESGIPFGKSRLHTYFPVDPVLMVSSVKIGHDDYTKKKQAIKTVEELCAYAVNSGMQVQFSPEGYSRLRNNGQDNFDFTTEIIMAAIRGGARIINFPDTIGGASKLQGDEYFINDINKHIAMISKEFPSVEMQYSIHCHNDFNLATENSINAVVDTQVSQVECTINGVGERAGNTSMEQIVMIINHFGNKQGLYTDFDLKMLQELSNYIATNMLTRQPHFPITGDSAAKHTAGGHANAILKDPTVYQPFDPKIIGKEVELVFGPLSGSNLAQDIINKAGYMCTYEEKGEICQFIKDFYADRRKGVSNEELMIAYFEYRKPIIVSKISYSKDTGAATIDIKGRFFGKDRIRHTHHGKNSALAALKEVIDENMLGYKIEHSNSKSEGEGINAYSVHEIRIVGETGVVYTGIGKDEDIETAAIKALINAANKAYIEDNYKIK